MTSCATCGGLVAEPNVAYGYAGKFCHCPRPLDKKAYRNEPPFTQITPCGCVGPQNGQPLCPCQMRGVTIKDGRYQRVQDLGPATFIAGQLSATGRGV